MIVFDNVILDLNLVRIDKLSDALGDAVSYHDKRTDCRVRYLLKRLDPSITLYRGAENTLQTLRNREARVLVKHKTELFTQLGLKNEINLRP